MSFSTAAAGAWLSAYWPDALAVGKEAGAARDAAAGFKTLTAEEAADFAAMAAQILPTDELPGANEAGVVYFMDGALGGFMKDALAGLRQGLAALNQAAGARFSTLSADRQVQVLKGAESSQFFGTVTFMTVAGMFAMPSYGGNRDHAGWKMLGFEHQMAWAPPFGYYDAAAAKSGGAK